MYSVYCILFTVDYLSSVLRLRCTVYVLRLSALFMCSFRCTVSRVPRTASPPHTTLCDAPPSKRTRHLRPPLTYSLPKPFTATLRNRRGLSPAAWRPRCGASAPLRGAGPRPCWPTAGPPPLPGPCSSLPRLVCLHAWQQGRSPLATNRRLPRLHPCPFKPRLASPW